MVIFCCDYNKSQFGKKKKKKFNSPIPKNIDKNI